MTVEEILNLDTEMIAAVLKTAFKGILVNEVYNGRWLKLERTDTTYIIKLNNPNAEILARKASDAVKIIKRELGNLPT